MSATKACRKWVQTATADEIMTAIEKLGALASTERNAMVRASLMAQRTIMANELVRRDRVAK